MEVFLIAYSCFNLNLVIFAETRSNRYVHSPLLKIPLRSNEESFIYVKTIFVCLTLLAELAKIRKI
jgi:hypothetical protein